MPNYCVNKLSITGPLKYREEFKKLIDSKGICFDFNSIIPYPEKYKKLDERASLINNMLNDMSLEEQKKYTYKHGYAKDGYNQGGYEWCINNWDTKWNALRVDLLPRKTALSYQFDTAWSPPIKVIAKAAELFPQLTFSLRFFESGAAFQGKFVWRGGKLIENKECEYNGRLGG